MNDRIFYLDLLKVFSLFAMMLVHVVMPYWYAAPLGTAEWYDVNIYACIVRWCVPIFFMISGALFINAKKVVTIEYIIKKNFLKIIICFLTWSFFYALANVLIGKINTFNSFFYALLTGQYHMWFLYSIGVVYLTVPFLRKIAENKIISLYFIIMSVLFSNIITIQLFLSQVNFISKFEVSFFNLNLQIGYIGYAMLGYFLSVTCLTKKIKIYIHVLSFISFIITIYGTSFLSIAIGNNSELFLSYIIPTTFCISMSVFILFKDYSSLLILPDSIKKVIQKISTFSLGMYLVHDFINAILNKATLYNVIPHFGVLLFLKSVIVFIASFFIVLFLKRILFFNKWCV